MSRREVRQNAIQRLVEPLAKKVRRPFSRMRRRFSPVSVRWSHSRRRAGHARAIHRGGAA